MKTPLRGVAAGAGMKKGNGMGRGVPFGRAGLEKLARRGLQDSSAGESVQRQRRLDEQDAETNLTQQVGELDNQIRSNQLSLAQNLYALASQSQNATDAKQYQAAIASQSQAASADAQRQASLLDYYSRVNGGKSTPLASTISSSLGDLFGSFKLFAGG